MHIGRRVVQAASRPNHRSPPVKAILCHRYGSADDLVLGDIPDPVAGPGEVVVKVAAVGLNFFDTLIIAGKYQTKPPFPFSPGGELAGVVERVGAGVTALGAGRPGHGLHQFQRGARAHRGPRRAAGQDPRRSRLRARRRAHHHVRHRLSRARASRPPRGRRDAGGARRLGRGRAGGGRARQDHGRARGRLRVDRRQARAGAPARRRRAGELRDASRCATRSSASAARTASTSCSIRSAGPTASRRSARSPGRAATWWSGSRPATFPSSRSIWCCSRTARCSGVFWGAWVRHDPAAYQAAISQLARWCADGKLACYIQQVYPLADTPQAIKALADRKAMGKLVVRL